MQITNTATPQSRGQYPQRQQTQTRNVRNINEVDNQTVEPPLEEEDYELETIDPEPTMYITELIEDWNKINLIERDFKNIKNSELNITTPHGEIIIQTALRNKSTLNWLVDTGSPRSFIDIQRTEELIQEEKQMKLEEYNGYMKLKCFSNKDKPIIGQIQMELQSGSWTATNCNILVVEHKSQNLMGRDIFTKLGLTLTQQQANKGKNVLNIDKNIIEKNITKWNFKKYPHICTRLGTSRNHIVKSILKKEKTPTAQGKKSTLTSSQKSRKRSTKTN